MIRILQLKLPVLHTEKELEEKNSSYSAHPAGGTEKLEDCPAFH